jgi:hypothetical protein
LSPLASLCAPLNLLTTSIRRKFERIWTQIREKWNRSCRGSWKRNYITWRYYCLRIHISVPGAIDQQFTLRWNEVLSTQCIKTQNPEKMCFFHVAGDLQLGVDQRALHYISSKLSTPGATGYFVEYAGKVFEDMTMEGMTVCTQRSKWEAWRNDCPRSNDFWLFRRTFICPKALLGTAVSYWKTLKNRCRCKIWWRNQLWRFWYWTNGTNPGLGISKSIPDSKDVVRGEETA